MQKDVIAKKAPIINDDLDYSPKSPSFISGKKTLDVLLRQQQKERREEMLNTLKILLVCAALLSSFILIIIFVLSKL
jgi:hypothetical protein